MHISDDRLTVEMVYEQRNKFFHALNKNSISFPMDSCKMSCTNGWFSLKKREK